MGGNCCAVATCKNTTVKNRKLGENVRYFRFPKDEARKKIWVKKCHRVGKWNPETSRICSEHFDESSFEFDFYNKLKGLPEKPKLKPSAIPTLKLTSNDDIDITKKEREERKKKRIAKKLVESLLQQSEIQDTSNETSVQTAPLPVIENFHSAPLPNEAIYLPLPVIDNIHSTPVQFVENFNSTHLPTEVKYLPLSLVENIHSSPLPSTEHESMPIKSEEISYEEIIKKLEEDNDKLTNDNVKLAQHLETVNLTLIKLKTELQIFKGKITCSRCKNSILPE